MKIGFLVLSVVVSGLGLVSPLAAAPPPAGQLETVADLTDTADMRTLFRVREDLAVSMRNRDRQVEDLQKRINGLQSAEQLQSSLDRAKLDLERLRRSPNPDADKIDSVTKYIENLTEDLRVVRAAGPEQQRLEEENELARRRLSAVELRISLLADSTKDTNRFRSNATYTFGVLVLLVVAGFYAIAWHKDGVAATIFAGELGMQFVTLFLIVIAIILFGIMGTLEGRELAALLGGLSGYILGRVDKKPEGLHMPAPVPPATSPAGNVAATTA